MAGLGEESQETWPFVQTMVALDEVELDQRSSRTPGSLGDDCVAAMRLRQASDPRPGPWHSFVVVRFQQPDLHRGDRSACARIGLRIGAEARAGHGRRGDRGPHGTRPRLTRSRHPLAQRPGGRWPETRRDPPGTDRDRTRASRPDRRRAQRGNGPGGYARRGPANGDQPVGPIAWSRQRRRRRGCWRRSSIASDRCSAASWKATPLCPASGIGSTCSTTSG